MKTDRSEYFREYERRPEVIARRKAWRQTEVGKKWRRAYQRSRALDNFLHRQRQKLRDCGIDEAVIASEITRLRETHYTYRGLSR